MWEFARDCNWFPIIACLSLSGLFVGSLYVWDSKHDRNHPSTIKKRFCSVFVVILISPFVMNLFIASAHLNDVTTLELLGFRVTGLFNAAVVPLILTMVLFLGPLCMIDWPLLWWQFTSKDFWLLRFVDLVWLRNVVVGPFVEEFTFRACLVPILNQCFFTNHVILMASLTFGIAHLHHFVAKYKAGEPVPVLIIGALVQFSYTTIFGAYSAFVFIQTAHFIAPFIIHAFCNSMGLPDFGRIFTYKNPKKIILIFLFVLGVVLWYLLLPTLLDHKLYDNHLYYDTGKVPQ